jgi:hypothetical protein
MIMCDLEKNFEDATSLLTLSNRDSGKDRHP